MPLADAISVRVTLIHNPGAGDTDHSEGKRLAALVRAAGHSVHYHSAAEPTWAAALDEPADIVAVAGGDGTVGRVAKKLIGRHIPVAPLPLGTANNIAKTLGLDQLTPEDIVAGWKNARHVAFDAGVAKGPWGSRYFIEGAGIGLFAEAIPAAEQNATLTALTDPVEKVAHARKMLRDRLRRATAVPIEFTLDGERYTGDYILFEAMNMEFVGPNLYLAPDTHPTDGCLDVVFVSQDERDALRDSLEQPVDDKSSALLLPRRRASKVTLAWTGFDVHFDDEAWPDAKDPKERALTEIELTLERQALRFLAV